MTSTDSEAQKWAAIIKERNKEFLAELSRTTPSMRFGSPFDNPAPPKMRLVEAMRTGIPKINNLEGYSRILLAKAA